jgi:hypothetical protein
VVSLTNSLPADWTGAVSSDWYNAANWTGAVPTSGDTTLIESSTQLTWPIIDGGTAETGQLRIGYTADYQGELTVTGGATLNVNGEIRLARKSNDGSGQSVGILHISGATTTINVTNRIACGRHGFGTIYMSGGYLHCDAELRLSYRDDGSGTVYLSGGTIDLGGDPGITVFAGDDVPGFALIDISGDGTLTLAGNQVSAIETFIGDGIITGYGGEGAVLVTYDGQTTAVVAAGGPASSRPNPDDGQTDVPRDVVLSWKPGRFAPAVNGHKVFFGENFDDVNDGIGGVTQSTNSYTPTQRLDFDKTYYWRVDEVNAPPDSTVYPGAVWSFTTEPVGYPVANVTATASSSAAGQGPENTVNGSGLSNDLHSTETETMWISDMGGPQPTWIQFELDKVHVLHEMWVWNSNTDLEASFGLGFRDVTIEYSVDGAEYTTLGTTHEFAQAPGADDYAHNTTVDFGGVQARYVRLTANTNWAVFPFPQFGLSEVRFLSIPVSAGKPSPDSGATDVDVDVTLGWRAGRQAAEHNVYLSADEQAVIDGNAPVTTVTEAAYSPSSLDLDSIYYWRVDEVNNAENPTTWQGDVWSFSTQEYLVVDDFESYNDVPAGLPGSNLVYLTWKDGYDNPATNGSTMGYPTGTSMETSIVYDGKQAAPLLYDNTAAAYSEVTANVADLQAVQDWAKHGAKALTLRFHGDPNNSVNERMYVELNGSRVTYNGDAGNLARTGWQMWYINLADFGVNTGNVTELSIGFERIGAFGGKGVVYLDGIRLYSHDPQVITPADPGTTGLQAHYQFEGNTDDSSGNARHGVGMGSPIFAAGKVGQAIELRGLDYVEITGYKGVLGANAFSMSAWIKTTLPEEQQIVYYGTNVSGQRCEFRVDDTGDVRMGTGGGQVTSLATVNDGGWHHVAVTISENATNSSSDVQIYVNGQDDTEESTDLDPLYGIVAGVDVTIGYRSSQDDRFFIGQIDDVRIYDRALSPEEAAWLAGRTKSFDKPF